MPISCECPSCGKRLKAPDSAAGKRALCPQCGNPVQIPTEIIHDAEEVPDAEETTEPAAAVPENEYALANVSNESGAPAPPEPDRRPCPMCGEMIPVAAVKCRYCGEFFDASLKRGTGSARGIPLEDQKLSAVEWVFCILCGGIACIVGIIYGIQGKPKGWKMVGVSIVAQIIWGIIQAILEQATKHQ